VAAAAWLPGVMIGLRPYSIAGAAGATFAAVVRATGKPTGTSGNVWYKVINNLWIRPSDGPADAGVPAC
jgi:hypothetical protein